MRKAGRAKNIDKIRTIEERTSIILNILISQIVSNPLRSNNPAQNKIIGIMGLNPKIIDKKTRAETISIAPRSLTSIN
ncbi:hypothetical protein J4229_02655 [Candidatus Pacearchaeota archaeon]|nr:hypothetical protein [Candidatus Pacearchaeota archaeon]